MTGGTAQARLLEAAARVFGRHGAAGTTTRRVADEAGVNEVTLFRLFKSKDALLDAAVHACTEHASSARLPMQPVDPEAELTSWCAGEISRLRSAAGLLRHCFAESALKRGHTREAGSVVAHRAEELMAYIKRLEHLAPLAANDEEREDAVIALVSMLTSDALGRESMPQIYTSPRIDAPRRYARFFLRAIGWKL
ncbi:MAG: TetR/AcrR family transcriptional regulator [Gemmatimonadaceae bacterium]|nr:TetR/AcrR family transcriptional regulator [Gemmatimonadaceae bacterium]